MKFLSNIIIISFSVFVIADTVGPFQIFSSGKAYAQDVMVLEYGPFQGAREGIWGDGNVSIRKGNDGSYELELSEDFSVLKYAYSNCLYPYNLSYSKKLQVQKFINGFCLILNLQFSINFMDMLLDSSCGDIQ